jgi:oxygen-independent coproporphyrinogen III oxidase
MAGIYIHIPFCRQACHYCNFHFSTSLKRKNEFVVALLKEIEVQKQYIGGETVDTLYFGGGTPSLLEARELGSITDAIHRNFSLDTNAEVTLEANPDDSDTADGAEKLRAWKAAGINRLSLGVQSFFEEDLRWMHRAHNGSQALAAIELLRNAGFDNLSVDLIYGGPTLPDAHWEDNLQKVATLGIPHLSCYALTVEPGTALDKMIHLQKKQPVSTEDQARQFLFLMDYLESAGYEQYEISNFALPGRRSRHNSAYWQGRKYLGLGPSAHSFDGSSRQWNLANNALYTEILRDGAGQALFEKEELTTTQQLNEYIMLSLRTREGCDLQVVSGRFGEDEARGLRERAERFVLRGKLIRVAPGGDLHVGAEESGTDIRLVLTRAGKLLADGIAADLFQPVQTR